MKNPKRTLFIGVIVWLLFFGWWFRSFLFINWRFRLFSFNSWRHLIDEFRHGWKISSLSDWIFIISFFLSIPIFLFLWYFFNKIEWKKLFKKIWNWIKSPFLIKKKSQLKKVEKIYAPKVAPASALNQRPKPIPTNGSTFSSVQSTENQMTFLNNSTAMPSFPSASQPISQVENAPSFKDFSSMPSQPEPTPFTNEAFAEMANTPLSEVEIPKMEPVEEDIPSLFEQCNYTLLDTSLVQEIKLDFLALAKEELVIALCDNEKGDWLADEESFNDEDPLWFSEIDHRVSPVFKLKQLSQKIQAKIGENIIVHPILIEKMGTIINAEDMLKTWNDLHISVCRTGMGGPVELATTAETLKPQEKISLEELEKVKSLL